VIWKKITVDIADWSISPKAKKYLSFFMMQTDSFAIASRSLMRLFNFICLQLFLHQKVV